MRTIDPSLQTWIAENLLLGVNPTALVTTLGNLGVAAPDAQNAVDDAANHPYFKLAKDVQTKLQKRDALLNTLDYYQRLDPDYLTLTPQHTLPPFKDFVRDYYSKNRPALFKNAANQWGAMQWTPQSLLKTVGAETIVQIQQGRDTTKDYEIESVNLRRNIRFGDFIEMVETGDTNDIYLTANNLALSKGPFAGLVKDIGNLGDGYLDLTQSDQRMFLWIGPKGTVTPLHHDKSNNVFVQVYGTKRFRLIPAIEVPYMYNHRHVFCPIDLLNPDYNQFPLYKRAGMIEVVVEPGDFLFIPIGWWHHVVGETASISLSFTNVPLPNQFFDYPA